MELNHWHLGVKGKVVDLDGSPPRIRAGVMTALSPNARTASELQSSATGLAEPCVLFEVALRPIIDREWEIDGRLSYGATLYDTAPVGRGPGATVVSLLHFREGQDSPDHVQDITAKIFNPQGALILAVLSQLIRNEPHCRRHSGEAPA